MDWKAVEECAIDSPIKRRLMLGFASNSVGKLASTIITFVQVPVFFHLWAASVYGNWLIVSAIPTYLAFSSIGFGNVASNEMTMLNSAGDREGARAVAEKIRSTIERSRILRTENKEEITRITVSLGAASYRPGESASEFIERVDSALYASKNQGRNLVTIAPATGVATPVKENKKK